MKKTSLPLLLAAAFLLIGCQEKPVTDSSGDQGSDSPSDSYDETMDIEVRYYADSAQETPWKTVTAHNGEKLADPGTPPCPNDLYPVFVGWSLTGAITSTDQLLNFETYVVQSKSESLNIYGQWKNDDGGNEPVDPDVDPDVPPTVEAGWYVVGVGSFVKEGQADWSVAGGVKMDVNPNPDPAVGAKAEYMLLGFALKEGDVWKCRSSEEDVWLAIFETEGDNNAFALNMMAKEDDNYGGFNAKVLTTGKYDLYLKIFDEAARNCIWVQPSGKTA